MNFKVEEILMVIVAFLIGWFLRTMTTSENNNSVIKSYGAKHTYQDGQGTSPKIPTFNEELMRTHRPHCFEENGTLKKYVTNDHGFDNGYEKGCGIVTQGKRCLYQDDCISGICAETCEEPDYCEGDTRCMGKLNPNTCRKIDRSNKCHRQTMPN